MSLKSEISSLKSNSVDATKKIKAREKSIHNLDKKNKHLNELKNDLKSENLKLVNEVKTLKKKNLVKSKSFSTQTEALQGPPCILPDADNNNTAATLSMLSSSTQTTMEFSDLTRAVSTMESGSTATQSIQCLICAKTCDTAGDLVNHTSAEHEVSMNVEKLTDPNEDDDFLRFLRSMNVDEQYLEERVQYYPRNCDHVFERIKIRILAQIKFSSFSKTIGQNMDEENYKYFCYKGSNREPK